MASELLPVSTDLEFEATIRRLEVTNQVFDRYKLSRILGRGGMGVVWLAHDERLDRDVALKFLPDEISFDPEAEDEMKRETRRCLDLTHPNIIRIYDFVKDRQAAAISMEYIDGKTLSAVKLEKPKRIFEVDELRPWIAQACQALAYAHEEVGIIHRDLKPANFMLTSRGQVKIADFGIAQSVSDSMGRTTIRRGTSGTLAYMSPQQMNGDLSQVTDDVYAMGATIYELLTSKPPFHSGNVSFQLRVMVPALIHERRDELEIRGSEVPKEWEETIAACLGKTPEDRPATMNELSERLGLSRAKLSPLQPEKRPSWQIPLKWQQAAQKFVTTLREKTTDWKANSPKSRPAVIASTAAVSMAILGWATWHWVVWPLLAPRAELTLASNPPGALVRLTGHPDVVTPTTISGLRMGHYSLTISADGYDSFSQTVDLQPGGKVDLGTIQLKQAFGQWSITAVPAHVHYRLAGPNNFAQEGTAPDFISSLPSGSYALAFSADGFASETETIRIEPHSLKSQDIDLVKNSLAGGINDAAAKVFRGEANLGSLDDQAKSELLTFHSRAFEQYLANGFFARAAEQLDHLRELGTDISARQSALDLKRTAKESEAGASIARLISSHKFASAAAMLKNVEGDLEKDSVGRLEARFQYALAPYQSQIDAALKAVEGAPVMDAVSQIEKLAGQYPDDIRLQVASANLLAQLPPDHDQLSRQIDNFRHLAQADKLSGLDPAVLKVRSMLENELRQLDTVLKNVNDRRAKLGDATNRIARLKEEKNDYEDRHIGRPRENPFASTLNFFSKAVTGHSAVNTQSTFASREEKESAIADIQTQIDQAQQGLPQLQAALDDAQKSLNDFEAQVPWKQG